MMIDLPAPVSPVSTVRPASNRTSRHSMMAKFWIESSDSMPLSQAIRQCRIEIPARAEAGKACDALAAADGHLMAPVQWPLLGTVHAHDSSAIRFDGQCHRGVAPYDDGPADMQMGRHGSDHEV